MFLNEFEIVAATDEISIIQIQVCLGEEIVNHIIGGSSTFNDEQIFS